MQQNDAALLQTILERLCQSGQSAIERTVDEMGLLKVKVDDQDAGA